MLDFKGINIFYGGSFDPVHLGHLHVACAAKKALEGAKIFFVPAGLSPGKPAPNASPELRRQWLESALRGTGFAVWDTELKRSGPSYTVDTLEEAHRAGADPTRTYLLIGADAYAGFSGWKDPERIRELAQLLVMSRPGTEIHPADARDVIREIPPHPASSSAIRAELASGAIPEESLPKPVSESLKKLSLLSKNPYARK